MVTKIFLYYLVILNDNGLKYEKYANFRKFPKGKKYFKNGQKKMSKIKKKFSNLFLEKISLFFVKYFCDVKWSKIKNSQKSGFFIYYNFELKEKL